jgi:predicted nuclease with TOPRIM domain
MFSGRAFTSEKDIEELATLKEQIGDLQLKLREKDELLKSAENLRDQMNAVNAKLDEMKHHVSEKDGSLKYTQQQLSDAKVLISLIIWHKELQSHLLLNTVHLSELVIDSNFCTYYLAFTHPWNGTGHAWLLIVVESLIL